MIDEKTYTDGENNLFSVKKIIDFGIKKNKKISCKCGWNGRGKNLKYNYTNIPELGFHFIVRCCPDCFLPKGKNFDLTMEKLND